MNWISVKDKLPEHEGNVLAVLDGEVCIMAYQLLSDSDGTFWWAWCYVYYGGLQGDAEWEDHYEPTHWMEIPKFTADE